MRRRVYNFPLLNLGFNQFREPSASSVLRTRASGFLIGEKSLCGAFMKIVDRYLISGCWVYHDCGDGVINGGTLFFPSGYFLSFWAFATDGILAHRGDVSGG